MLFLLKKGSKGKKPICDGLYPYEVLVLSYDSKRPFICMDEQPIELHADSREPIGLSESNHTEKIDHEYIRCGTFMFTEPLGRWRNVTAREHRKKLDWAGQIKALVYDDYPDAEKVVLICDNINTHNFSSSMRPSPHRRQE